MQTLYVSRKEGPKVLFAELYWCHWIFSSHTTEQGSPETICIHSFTAGTDFSPFSGCSDPRGPFGSACLPHLPGDRSWQSSTARLPPSPCGQLVKEKRDKLNFPVFPLYWSSPGGICCVCFGYGLLPRVDLSPARRGNGAFLCC